MPSVFPSLCRDSLIAYRLATDFRPIPYRMSGQPVRRVVGVRHCLTGQAAVRGSRGLSGIGWSPGTYPVAQFALPPHRRGVRNAPGDLARFRFLHFAARAGPGEPAKPSRNEEGFIPQARDPAPRGRQDLHNI